MLLTSSLEQANLQSSKHYIILHHDNQCDLVTLPESYSDLATDVQRLYHIEHERFHVETEELNLCRGKRVRIPQDAWDDVAKLLGNVHIVPRTVDNDSPESPPQDKTIQQPEVHTAAQGEIALNEPLEEGGALVLNIGEIDLKTKSLSSTKFNAQLLDHSKNCALTISIFPQSGWIFLSSPIGEAKITRPLKALFHAASTHHNIVIRREQTQFKLLCDLSFVGTIGTTANSALTTTVSYNLGVDSPFKGPMSAKAYPDFSQLSSEIPLYRSMFPIVDKETLYQQILACNSSDASYIFKTLSSIRNEITSFKTSVSGVTWRSYQDLKVGWNDIEWNMEPHCIMVARTTVDSPVAAESGAIAFGPSRDYQFQISLNADKSVVFYKFTREPSVTLSLPNGLHSPGEHAVAFIKRGQKLHIFIDFCKVFVGNVAISQTPKEMWFNILKNKTLEVDFYGFGGP